MSISGNVEGLLQTGVRVVRATQLSHWHERFDVDGADLLRFITSLRANLAQG
jgi:hypothetical protein